MISVSQAIKNSCKADSNTHTEYIVINNQIIYIQGKLNATAYKDSTFFGTFNLKVLEFETPNTTQFRNKEFEYYKVIDGNAFKIGTFITTEVKDNDSKETVRVTANDYGLKFAVPYETELDYEGGQVTLFDVLEECCTNAGVLLENQTIENGSFVVDSNQFVNGEMIGDVICAIAGISGNFATITSDDKLRLLFTNETDEILEDYTDLEDKRDTHPITSVSIGLSQVEGVEAILRDETLIEEYGEHWLTINDNPFAYTLAKRQQLITAIFNKVKGFGYSSFKSEYSYKPYLELGDKIKFKNKAGNLIDSIVLRYEFNNEKCTFEAPSITDSTIDYERAPSPYETAKRAEIIANQAEASIVAITQKVEDLEQSIEVLSADLDTNVIVIPVDSSNVPFTTKTYTIDYRVKYLGNPITSGYTISTTDTHTGITTNLTTLGTLQFSVSNSTAISSIDNKYTFTISYVVGEDTYSVTKSVMLSLISSESEQNVVISDTAPSDTEVLWYDSSTDQLKRYVDTEWELVNDFSSDISSIYTNISTLNSTIQDNYNELNGAISNLSVNVSTQFQQTTDSFNASISRVTNDINDKDSATNTRIDDIQSYLSYALEEVYNPITQTTSTTGVVTIGEANSDIKLKLANNILFFDVKGQNAGYLGTDSASNSKLYFVDANLLNSVRIGNYQFIPRTNGSLSFRKVD